MDDTNFYRPGKPDIVVGIDVGQTCSGIAYSIGPDWSEPRTLNKWPSNEGIEKADKVATCVGYAKSDGRLVNWGFKSDFRDINVVVHEQFKLFLDAEYDEERKGSCEEARRWYFDYLRCLYYEIEKFFDSTIPAWRSLQIEYNFSTPTTWRNPAMIASIEKLISRSGFGSTRQQTVRMALTEAEAAAIEASTTQYKKGDVFLICDAGGGTTDVNILKVKSFDRQIELEPLDHVEGVPIGSTLIDFKVTQYIVERLGLISDKLEGDVFFLAEQMLKGRFQTIKHSFPDPVIDEFYLDVKGLPGSQTFPEADITNSKMKIPRTVLQAIFDQQIGRIVQLIDERLLHLQNMFPSEEVCYIILSGGLGSSPYLYQAIKNRYQFRFDMHLRNTRRLTVMKVLEPQLAVVYGLVKERTQQIGTNTSLGEEVFSTRCCRNSYGIVVRELYDETRHAGLPFIEDANDGCKWAPNLIDWFIRQGQRINVAEGIKRPYNATITHGAQHAPRRAQIVMSSLPAHQLPRALSRTGWTDVATVVYQLTDNDLKLKNRQLWKVKKKYWRANFDFVVLLGPADLRFQIRGRDGVISSDHERMGVEFVDPGEVWKVDSKEVVGK
ncbi:hypothetical protein BDZ85DRAFT_121257 [Elsinoe ampelina]|uniref:Actin-like ATPase domain-containing protein n=1 Tax=Elsinoe ampelina TaxID=302913 RepID=A0A6A6GCH2_9PEZI|nr:hypothetical protein BDZ85DRAFT_121257 [Elsinoe ampelina]